MTHRVEHHRPQFPDQAGQFKKSYHLEMIADRVRTGAIFRALEKTLQPSSVFCELGCGTGIFSIFAAARCQRVIAVELDANMARVARENIRRCEFADRIELLECDALELELPDNERADVVLCEMMSIWAIEEPQVAVVNHARDHVLKPNGEILPQRITNMLELGRYEFEHSGVAMRTTLPLFTGIEKPAVMTERRLARVLDFANRVDVDLGADVEFVAIADGVINCAQLTSVVQFCPDVVFSGTDSLMPPTVLPIQTQLAVRSGTRLSAHCAGNAYSDMASFQCAVKKC